MSAQLMRDVLGLFSGSIVGFSLGLVGGGGSILAVPLLIYLVGVPSAHVAIGTSAFAVAANAATNLAAHARMKTVKWRCAAVFAVAGMLGSYGGSSVSKLVDGPKLIGLFALLMLIIAGVMFARRGSSGDPNVRLNRENLPRLLIGGITIGALSGFFGIGGGFLIVPGLMLAAGMPIMNAVSSSLVAVTAFGATAAVNYAASGLVDWRLVVMLLIGGVAGGLLGSRVARTLGAARGALNATFAAVIIAVALYMLWRTFAS
jgi:uncharacterized membrane protein YfcA